MAALVNVDAGSLFGLGTAIIERMFPSEEQRSAALLKLKELEQKGELAQLAVNQAEAANPSIFVAGWRPFIGWVCGFAFAYSFLVQPFMTFIAWAVFTATGHVFPLDTLPQLNMSDLMTVLFGMLGLGWMRSQDKRAGVSTIATAPRQRG